MRTSRPALAAAAKTDALDATTDDEPASGTHGRSFGPAFARRDELRRGKPASLAVATRLMVPSGTIELGVAVMAEMLDMAMFHVIGCDTALALAAQAGQLELNVMMPIIAHNLFEAMQVNIGAVKDFPAGAVSGLQANREKAEGWLAKNPIVATALNPLIGYAQGAALVKEALKRGVEVRQVALEQARLGKLKHRTEDRPVTEVEIETALKDLRKLTEGGIH